jgi:hypothetical protein
VNYDVLITQLLGEMSVHARSGLLPTLWGLRVHGQRLLYLRGSQLMVSDLAYSPMRAAQHTQRLSRHLRALTHERAALLALKELAR